MKTRVLYFLDKYPQLSETYVSSEIAAVADDYDLRVVSLKKADITDPRHLPFEMLTSDAQLAKVLQEFRPHVMHTHFLHTAQKLDKLARSIKVPYTVRAHSFDTISRKQAMDLGDYCLGFLTFPFTRQKVEALGVSSKKIIECYPVVNYSRFYDPSPAGKGILNLGACRPKKKFEDFIDLAALMPNETFNLCSIGYTSDSIRKYNVEKGGRVNMLSVVQPHEMPALYKKHAWLVYTACPVERTVGWPMGIAEAQASGLGICMARIRPDLDEYLGGAGFLYDSIHELPDILSKPYPEEMRQRGFEQARKSDIAQHKKLLTDLWDTCNKSGVATGSHAS